MYSEMGKVSAHLDITTSLGQQVDAVMSPLVLSYTHQAARTDEVSGNLIVHTIPLHILFLNLPCFKVSIVKVAELSYNMERPAAH